MQKSSINRNRILHKKLASTKYTCDLDNFASPPMKILLVDDETDILDSVKSGLELKGFEVDAFDDPLKALHNFRKGVYEIALLDIRMPQMNGFQLYNEIRKRDEEVRVRFFTAYEVYREEFKKAFPELDERRFIQKPTTLAQLSAILLKEVKVTN